MADWEGFDLSKTIENSAEAGSKIGDTLQATASVVNTVASILDVLKTFFQATSDPRLAAVKTILNQIQKTVDNIQESGVFALFMTPNSLDDLAENYQGGYPKFETDFINSLYDTQDSERPQIGSSGSLGALFLYTSSGVGGDLLSKLEDLAQGFSQDLKVSYPAPINFRVHPANAEGIPMDRAIIDSFIGDEEPEGLVLEWEEPRVSNDVFLDIFGSSKFYIEKSKNITGESLQNEEVPKDRENPLEKRSRKEGDGPKLKGTKASKTSGSQIRVWEPLDENNPFIEPGNNTGPGFANNFIAGTYSYHIDDVDKGVEHGHYYRVRAVPSDVQLTQIDDKKVLEKNGIPYTEAPPSTPRWGSLPDVDYDFDLPSALLNIYRAAYQFRMDQAVYDDQGNLLTGSETLERAVPPNVFGQENQGDKVGSLSFQDNDGFSDSVFWLKQGMFPAGNVSDFDKTNRELKEDLIVDPLKFDAFGGVDEFVAPRAGLDLNEQFRLSVDRLVEEKVEKIVPVVSENDTLFQLVQRVYQGIEGDLDTLFRDGLSEGQFINSTLRSDISTVIRIMERNSQQGAPPNWESINFLEDLLPEVDRLFDELFGIITTLDNSLQSVLDDITDTIEGVQDRIEKLTSIITLIEDLIEFLEELKNILDIDLKVLWVPPKTGGTGYLVKEFLDAQDKPTTEENDFYSAIVLAVGGQNPVSYKPQAQALKLIFGV